MPREKWEMLKLSDDSVEVVCISKDYKVSIVPQEIDINPIFMMFDENEIIEIDERKKTITVDIRLWCIWRDERIKVAFADSLGIIEHPPITTEEKPKLWNPFGMLKV